MPSSRLKIAVSDHYRRSVPFAYALSLAGHELVAPDAFGADVFLIDFDPPLEGYRRLIDGHADAGAKVVLYPHAAGGPMLSYDAIWEPYERVDANFVAGVGHAEFLRRIEYPAPVHTIGWTSGDQRPFQPRADVRRVLFAPTHPNADGSMLGRLRDENAEVFTKLLEGPWKLTVRHIGTLEENGLWPVDGVEFVDGRTVPPIKNIDATDAVVAGAGSFPTISVSRGVPTVIYGQGSVVLGLPDEETSPLRRGERYLDYVRFPFDVADGPLDEVVHAAASSPEGIADWRRRFVGHAFHPGRFAAAIEQLAQGRPEARLDETRAFTTLALADELAEHPHLLRTYVDAVRPSDDASLILWAPGLAEADLLDLAQYAIGRAGIDEAALPDVLLAPLPGGTRTAETLAERADAVLSDWPAATGPIGALERFSGLPTLTT
ncbi:hypothetical protein [Solirubrobacter soli]|uniref:hypothetical protein n=1 Tax=Solirubrobacter soli TaxID=363832 RepID=UPI0003FD6A31|nr:hypothetical protein [Solirubrobacter soli]